MAVPVTAGSHTIEVQWSATRGCDRGTRNLAVALLALVLMAALERKFRRDRRV